MIQSPIADSDVVTTLAKDALASEEVIRFSGISSFFAGDYIRVGAADTGEIMKIISVGIGTTNGIKVERAWAGSALNVHPITAPVTNLRGNYNIVGNKLILLNHQMETLQYHRQQIHHHLEIMLV